MLKYSLSLLLLLLLLSISLIFCYYDYHYHEDNLFSYHHNCLHNHFHAYFKCAIVMIIITITIDILSSLSFLVFLSHYHHSWYYHHHHNHYSTAELSSAWTFLFPSQVWMALSLSSIVFLFPHIHQFLFRWVVSAHRNYTVRNVAILKFKNCWSVRIFIILS